MAYSQTYLLRRNIEKNLIQTDRLELLVTTVHAGILLAEEETQQRNQQQGRTKIATVVRQPPALVASLLITMGNRMLTIIEPAIVIMPP